LLTYPVSAYETQIVLNERSADVRALTDAVAVDDGIHQRKRAQEKDQRNSRVATRAIHRGAGGGRRGDSLKSTAGVSAIPEILPFLKGENPYGSHDSSLTFVPWFPWLPVSDFDIFLMDKSSTNTKSWRRRGLSHCRLISHRHDLTEGVRGRRWVCLRLSPDCRGFSETQMRLRCPTRSKICETANVGGIESAGVHSSYLKGATDCRASRA